MRIIKSVQTKVCVDGSLMKEYVLDKPLTEGFLKFLEQFGTVRFLDQLRKPYFSFEKEQFISIKGFVGESNVEVRYKKEFQDLVADYFHLLLYYYDQGEKGISALKGQEDVIRKKMKVRLGPSDKITTRRIWIDGKETGIDQLDWIIDEVKKLNLSDNSAISEELIKRTQKLNYVPTKKIEEYKAALLDEFHKKLSQ